MKAKIHCVLIEDEIPALEVLEHYFQHYQELHLGAHFSNVFSAQDYIKEQPVDLIFLDINLPGLNGLDFLRSLKNPPLIVITSAYDEHAIEAFDLAVFDYLLKPYSLSRFNKTIVRLKDHFLKRNQNIIADEQLYIKSGTKHYKLSSGEINYIESDREYLLFHLEENKQLRARMTIKEVLNLLPGKMFIQIHRSFIVNLKKVSSVNASSVQLFNKELPIGRLYKRDVLNQWERL